MKLNWISILYFALPLPRDVYRQNEVCNKDVNTYTLDSCDGSEVSENNIYIDFGEIKYQCSCSISLNFSGQTFYNLATNPGDADCGTAVRVIDSNSQGYRLPCTTYPKILVLISISSTVELDKVNPVIEGPTGYCLRVFTYDVSSIITASCGSLESTSTQTNLRKKTYIVPRQSTNEGRSRLIPGYDIQTRGYLMRINTEFISYSSTTEDICGDQPQISSTLKKNTIRLLTCNGQLIGLVISGILVFILSGIIITLVIYIVRYQKRKSTLKNDNNRTEIPESLATQTSPTNRPTSTYTTLNPVEANDFVEQPYTGLNIVISPEVNQGAFTARPNSAYISLNPDQDKSNTEKLYTDLTNETVYYESN